LLHRYQLSLHTSVHVSEWDTVLASLLAGLDNKDIAYSNFFQVIKAKTGAGFVPGLATGGYKTHDRSKPALGAKVMLELFRKYNDTWAVEVVFNDLLDWNNWIHSRRVLQPAGLIALGTHEEIFGKRQLSKNRSGANFSDDSDLQKAKFESGMDNSPMYDHTVMDEDSHLMQLYDVGMSSLFAQEAYSLAELADAIGRGPELSQRLRLRGDAMRDKIRSELWDPYQQIFANRYPNGTFSNRISPTSFYPLLVGAADPAQAEIMVHQWLLNASRFCISPTGDFAGNDPNGCYYGLPSISADDPAYMTGNN
jgi:putative isomerase